jgi:two-component system response regulator
MANFEEVQILLAEDSPTDAEMTLRALKKIGVTNEVIWVKDGQEAMDYIFCEGAYSDRTCSKPRLVLLDLKMPKMNGIDVLRELKKNEDTKAIPVVMLTSSAEEQDIAKCYELGTNSYIVKPVEFDKFVEEVSKVGCYWAVMNKIPHM